VGEDKATLEEVYEPFLIRRGLIQRTSRGRIATERAYTHLGYRYTPNPSLPLFDENPDSPALG
jgi:Holliday junction DNA helicase RuvB